MVVETTTPIFVAPEHFDQSPLQHSVHAVGFLDHLPVKIDERSNLVEEIRSQVLVVRLSHCFQPSSGHLRKPICQGKAGTVGSHTCQEDQVACLCPRAVHCLCGDEDLGSLWEVAKFEAEDGDAEAPWNCDDDGLSPEVLWSLR